MGEQKEEGVRKPGFDARQRYYEVLMGQLEMATRAAEAGDLRKWYLLLHSIYNKVVPWIAKEDSQRILNGDKVHMKYGLMGVRSRVYNMVALTGLADTWARQASNDRRLELELELLNIEGALMNSAKHMMLPTGEEDADLSVEEFMRMSGV